MSNPVIQVENLGKKYQIGGPRERYQTFRDTLMDFVRSPIRRLAGSPKRETIWALKDVSFEVNQGDRIGIIGRNGAGKTLS